MRSKMRDASMRHARTFRCIPLSGKLPSAITARGLPLSRACGMIAPHQKRSRRLRRHANREVLMRRFLAGTVAALMAFGAAAAQAQEAKPPLKIGGILDMS